MKTFVGGYGLQWEDLRTFLESVNRYSPSEEAHFDNEDLYTRYMIFWHQSDFKKRGIPILNFYFENNGEWSLILPTGIGVSKDGKKGRRPKHRSLEIRDKFITATQGAFPSERMIWKCVPMSALVANLDQ